MSLLEIPEVKLFRPMKYPWAFDYFIQQQKILWLPEEVPMGEDIKDWRDGKLSDAEKNLATHIFRFFVQGDVVVGDAYINHFIPVFQPIELTMMMKSFSNAESIHVIAYAHLIDTLGLPESEYSIFLQYKEMKDKYDYFQTFNSKNKHEIAKTIAAFSACTEGLQLFASFAILMNFPRSGKLKGMGQIVSWSIRDESLHVEGMLRLFVEFLRENPEIWTKQLHNEILQIFITTVEHEDAFVDLAFSMGEVPGITANEVKLYVRYIADRRLLQLGMATHFNVKVNPFPWLDEMTGIEFTNIFENKPTEYSRASTMGTWDDVFE